MLGTRRGTIARMDGGKESRRDSLEPADSRKPLQLVILDVIPGTRGVQEDKRDRKLVILVLQLNNSSLLSIPKKPNQPKLSPLPSQTPCYPTAPTPNYSRQKSKQSWETTNSAITRGGASTQRGRATQTLLLHRRRFRSSKVCLVSG